MATVTPFILGAQKNVYERLLASKTPSNMEANLGSPKLIFETRVGLHFWESLGGFWAPMTTFWGSLLGALLGPPKIGHQWISLENLPFDSAHMLV